MPRGPRLDAPGLLHHVRARGIERRKIFVTDRDRKDFIERLELVCAKDAAFVYAWALIPNHFHLAIRTGVKPLSTTMRRLLTGYATAFNLRHRRVGHVFQNRFWSKVVEDESYFLGLVRYIHLNPIRAKIVKGASALGDYDWTGHSALMGGSQYGFQDTDEVLNRFGRSLSTARRGLVDFMLEPQANEESWVFRGGGLARSMGRRPTTEDAISRSMQSPRKREKQAFDERILGDGQFVESVLDMAEEEISPSSLSPTERRQQIHDLIMILGRRTKLDFEEIVGRGRRHVVARARWAIAWLAIRKLGMTATDTAKALGQGPTAVIKRAARGEKVLADLGIAPEKIIAELDKKKSR